MDGVQGVGVWSRDRLVVNAVRSSLEEDGLGCEPWICV